MSIAAKGGQAVGLRADHIEDHSEGLTVMVRQIEGRLPGAEIMVGLKRLDLPKVDFSSAKQFAQAAQSAILGGKLGYVAIRAIRE